ncbi:MAG: 50S ribosomal protein L3 [Candidatus Woesearchaeota archaeon]
MGKKVSAPRRGSLQYWPRKRAQRQHARVRSHSTEAKGLVGFAGYKAGMTQIMATDNKKNSLTKGQDINIPVTIIECPPLKIAGIRFYKDLGAYGAQASTQVHFEPTKYVTKYHQFKKTGSLDKITADEYAYATIIVHTQPHLTGIGQKKPQFFELDYQASVQEAIDFVKENKELSVQDILAEGAFVDTHSVTTGKGTQGVVKRFGVGLRSHKSEKSARKAVIAPEGYAKVQYTAPQRGKMGYHLRTEYNKQILAIKEAEEVQISGGIVNYGNPKNTVLLIKGSVGGPKKRLITFTHPRREDKTASTQAMTIQHIATRSQQGNQ